MDLQRLYRKLMNQGRVERIEAAHRPKGLSAKTVGNIHQVISSAMDFAVSQKIIVENPCHAVALPKVEHKEMHTIPAEQLQAFLNEAKASGVYEMYYIELATGLRHTLATLALQNGVDIKTVSGMLGHFFAGFTLDTYAHVTTAAQKEAAEIIGNVLKI